MHLLCDCSLHSAGQRWVPIIDAGIPVSADDAAYRSGLAAGVFIKDRTGQPFTGQVCPAGKQAHQLLGSVPHSLSMNRLLAGHLAVSSQLRL